MPIRSNAQSAAKPESRATQVLSVTSRLVVLDVGVTDAANQPVTDLSAADFEVTEDGVRQVIEHFEPPAPSAQPAETSHGAAEAAIVRSSADLDRLGDRPLTILLLDELNMPFQEETYARQQVQQWLRSQPAVLREPTLLLALTYTDLHVLQDTTQDRDRMLATLDKHVAATPWRYGNVGVVEGAASDAMAETLGALDQIAKSMRGLPGRKNLFWVGDGFRSFEPTDVSAAAAKEVDDHLREVEQALFHARVRLSTMGNTVRPPNTFTHKQTISQILGGIVDFQLLGPEGNIAFVNLAAPTGGKAFSGRNDLAQELTEAEAASEAVYGLAYTPTNHSDDPRKFRHISVRVLRPGLHVQTRNGYYPEPPRSSAAPATPSHRELGFDFFGVGFSRLPFTDLQLRPVRVGPRAWQLSVRATDVGWQDEPDGTRRAEDVVLAMCFDRNNRLVGKVFHSVSASTGASEVQLLGRQVPLNFELELPPATARIRFVVRDSGSGRVGAADVTP